MCFSPNPLGGPLLNLLQFIDVFPVLRTQSWTLQSNECRVKQDDRFPQSMAYHTAADIAQGSIGCLCLCRPVTPAHLLSTMSFLMDLLLPSQSVARLNHCSLYCLLSGLQHFAFVLVEFRNVPVSPFLQAVTLDASPALGCIHSCPFLVSPGHLVSCAPLPLQVIDKGVQQDRSHCRLLQCSYWEVQ